MRNDILIIKRDCSSERFDKDKIRKALRKAFKATHTRYSVDVLDEICALIESQNQSDFEVETIQDIIEGYLMDKYPMVAKAYILKRHERELIRKMVNDKKKFIQVYKGSKNTADATVDDNSNVANKNIGVMNSEIHKSDNIEVSRGMIMDKLRELFPDFDAKQYVRDLQDHIIYKNDESSFCGPVAPYCVSGTMYPFLNNGIRDIGGLSAAPKNLDSYCGMYVNYVFATSAMFAGAVATPEFLLYFDHFARKEWGDDYYTRSEDTNVTVNSKNIRNIKMQIHQYFQQVVYSINQPSAARGLQSAFVNFSYFDKPFFEGMFGDFYFPDGSRPQWESLNWLQKEFMMWFNDERLKCILTFPVESFALVYKDGKFEDKENADFVAAEYSRGHSFFTYISDSVDSLSSCCRLKNMVQTKEFNFTNGNLGVQTGSKSVITLNLSRIIQDAMGKVDREEAIKLWSADGGKYKQDIAELLESILERVYKYHIAYNEYLWDMYDCGLLPVYKAGFINLNKQYLTIGLNGLNQAAEYLGIKCNDNEEYKKFCQFIFGYIKELNTKHNGKYNGHTLSFNTEQVPAESLAVKNYNWDLEDEYWVPEDTNLYASYIFKPNDNNVSILEKIRMHGRDYIGDYLDGGAAAHLNLEEHLSYKQYQNLLEYAAEVGCQYFTFNVVNCECKDCGFITKRPIDKCPHCGSEHIDYYDRVIGYLTKITNWSSDRQKEQKLRVYESINKED